MRVMRGNRCIIWGISRLFYRWVLRVCAFTALSALPALGQIDIYDGGSGYLAFEATSGTISNYPPTVFATLYDPEAGENVLYTAGLNEIVPSSFVSYTLLIATPGVYTLYYQWRADTNWTALDPSAANTFLLPKKYGGLGGTTNFTPSASSIETAPADTVYHITAESIPLAVTPADILAGPVVLTVGLQKAGMFIERFVLSTNASLEEADFDALVDSATSLTSSGGSVGDGMGFGPGIGVFTIPESLVSFGVESFGNDYARVEGEAGILDNVGTTVFAKTNDLAASAGAALYVFGTNAATRAPSFAAYAFYFGAPGDYKLYYRWKADTNWHNAILKSSGAFLIPSGFGASTNPADLVPSVTAQEPWPADGLYHLATEPVVYTVTSNMAGAGPVALTLGSAAPGVFLDCLALSLKTNLTESEFNALQAGPPVAVPPRQISATGSATLTNLSIGFDQPLSAGSLIVSNIVVDGGLTIIGATLDPVNLSSVRISTTPQIQGRVYNFTIGGLLDWAGDAGASDSGSFSAWVEEPGWVEREFYFGLANPTLEALTNDANFPNDPDIVDFAAGFQMTDATPGTNYGLRVTTWFVPPTNGVYDFYLLSDDEAVLSLSSDATEANLAPWAATSCCATNSVAEAEQISPGDLVAGNRYMLRALFAHGSGPGRFQVVIIPDQTVPTGGPFPPAPNTAPLGGSQIVAFVNPDIKPVALAAPLPDSSIGPAGVAAFAAQAIAPFGTVSYQWQLNGVDIPGATRPSFTTAPLSPTNNGETVDVRVTAGGVSETSVWATITVTNGPAPAVLPYIGVKFVAAAGTTETLAPVDVTGVVPQGNFNNIPGNQPGTYALLDENGTGSPVVLTEDADAVWPNGLSIGSAQDALMEAAVFRPDYTDLHLALGGVPPGTYNLILYAVGVTFQGAEYREAISVAGSSNSPTLHVMAEEAADYLANPVFIRADGANSAAPEKGNYFEFDNVHPGPNGSIVVTVSAEPDYIGNGFPPVISGFQLVSVSVSNTAPGLVLIVTPPQILLYWGNDAAGYRLESSTDLSAGEPGWSPLTNAPNPLPSSGGATNALGSLSQFFRLRQ
jgi:hypothetical protein